jgi:hypothetical protein
MTTEVQYRYSQSFSCLLYPYPSTQTAAKFYAMDGGEAAFAEYAEIVAAELCKVQAACLLVTQYLIYC